MKTTKKNTAKVSIENFKSKASNIFTAATLKNINGGTWPGGGGGGGNTGPGGGGIFGGEDFHW